MSIFKDYFKVIETTKPIDEEGKFGLKVQIDYVQVKPLDFNDLDLEPKESIAEHLRRQYKQKTDIDISALVVMEALEKAKQYDKLSKELGCPLEVVFKALKSLGQDIIYEWQDGINKMYHKDTPSDEFCLVYCCPNGTGPFEYCFLFKDNIGIEICLPLKYYGKTWWLISEREESE